MRKAAPKPRPLLARGRAWSASWIPGSFGGVLGQFRQSIPIRVGDQDLERGACPGTAYGAEGARLVEGAPHRVLHADDPSPGAGPVRAVCFEPFIGHGADRARGLGRLDATRVLARDRRVADEDARIVLAAKRAPEHAQ